MYKSSENANIRYQANTSDISSVECLIFPICITIVQSNTIKAIEDVKQVVENFCQYIEKVEIKGAKFSGCDLKATYNNRSAKIAIHQSNKNEVKLVLEYFGLLTLEANTNFWNRAEAIANCIDSIQIFCLRSHGKQIEVTAQDASTSIIQTGNNISLHSMIV
jgi:hypothetical protein